MEKTSRLVFSWQVSVLKRDKPAASNLIETLHAERYKTLQGKERRERLNELFAALREQQTTGGQGISDAAVKPAKLIANEIVQASNHLGRANLWKSGR